MRHISNYLKNSHLFPTSHHRGIALTVPHLPSLRERPIGGTARVSHIPPSGKSFICVPPPIFRGLSHIPSPIIGCLSQLCSTSHHRRNWHMCATSHPRGFASNVSHPNSYGKPFFCLCSILKENIVTVRCAMREVQPFEKWWGHLLVFFLRTFFSAKFGLNFLFFKPPLLLF